MQLTKILLFLIFVLNINSCAGWNQHLETRTNVMLSDLGNRANRGDIEAQYDLGMKYALGYNQALFQVPQDYSQAAYWLEMAANNNHSKAQFKLSELYFYGLGVNQDPQKALNLLITSKNGGYQLAADLYNHLNRQGMVHLINNNPEEAKRVLNRR